MSDVYSVDYLQAYISACLYQLAYLIFVEYVVVTPSHRDLSPHKYNGPIRTPERPQISYVVPLLPCLNGTLTKAEIPIYIPYPIVCLSQTCLTAQERGVGLSGNRYSTRKHRFLAAEVA